MTLKGLTRRVALGTFAALALVSPIDKAVAGWWLRANNGAAVAPSFSVAPAIVDQSNIGGTGYSIPVGGNAAVVSFTGLNYVSAAFQWGRVDRLGNYTATSGATSGTYTYVGSIASPQDWYSFPCCDVTLTDGFGQTVTMRAMSVLDVAPPGVASTVVPAGSTQSIASYAVAVWRLTDPSLTGAPLSTVFKKVGVDTLPTGWTIDTATPPNITPTSSNLTLDGWDVDGCRINCLGSLLLAGGQGYSNIVIRNCKNVYNIDAISDSGAIIEYNTVNAPTNRSGGQLNNTSLISSTIGCNGGIIRYNKLSNAYQDVLDVGGNMNIHHNDFGPLNTNYGGHADQIQIGGGNVGGSGAAMTINMNKLVGRSDGLQTQVFRIAPATGSVGKPFGYGVNGTVITNNVVGNYNAGAAAMFSCFPDLNGAGCFNNQIHDNLMSGTGPSAGYFYNNQRMGVTVASANRLISDGSAFTEYYTTVPVNTAVPTLSATATVGTPITITGGTSTFGGATSTGGTQRVERSDNIILVADASGTGSYTPTTADRGLQIRVLEFEGASDHGGITAVAVYSAWSATIS